MTDTGKMPIIDQSHVGLRGDSGIRTDPNTVKDEATGRDVSAATESIKMLSKGDMPSNEMLKESIESTERMMEERVETLNLNDHGKVLVNDTQRLLTLLQKFLMEKNGDQLFQKLVKQNVDAKKRKKQEEKEMEKHQKKKDQQKPMVKNLREEDLLTLTRKVIFELVRSKRFRELLREFLELLQDVFWGQSRLAEKEMEESDAQIEKGINHLSVLDQNAERVEDQRTLSVDAVRAQQEAEKEKIRKKYEGRKEITPRERSEHNLKARKLIGEFAQNPNYHHSMARIFLLGERFTEFLEHLMFSHGSSLSESSQLNPNSQSKADTESWTDVRQILERFVGQEDLEKNLRELRVYYDRLTSDPRAIHAVREGRRIVVEGLRDAALLNDPMKIQSIDQIIDQLRSLALDERFNEAIRGSMEISSNVVQSIRDDELSVELDHAIKDFGRHIAFNSNQKFSIGTLGESLHHLKEIILPVLIKQFENIPVEKVELFTPTYELTVSNLLFKIPQILPDTLQITMNTDVQLAMNELAADKSSTIVELQADRVFAQIEDMKFAYIYKSFPKIQDEGIADVIVKRNGMKVVIAWELETTGNHMIISTKRVECVIDSLKIKVKQANHHKVLDKVITKVLKGAIRVAVQDQMEEYQRTLAKEIASKLNRVLSSIWTTKPKSAVARQ
eukprot:TRINITY_DN4005_c0_g2_i1.p1 TRINITY_DN4005_c0_g2~~TRINITY_DN4005_c0_g2_i1.p1  ORF type:complete len:674 (-),score=280.82 TRINITY_DN4005_c0_g2_i1:15-2036(-)